MGQKTICILPNFRGMGGPASFSSRLASGLRLYGVQVTHDPFDKPCDALLVIGGLSRMDIILRAKRRGMRVVQRLNGMNWIHRKRKTGWKHYLRAEWNNRVLAITRRWIADRVVYQSHFAENWWRTVYRAIPQPERIIYNGVDLSYFHPGKNSTLPADHTRLLLVEGHLKGGYEQGLESAVELARHLTRRMEKSVELMVVGDVSPEVQARWQDEEEVWIHWKGVVSGDIIPEIDRSAHVLFSADLNAACPNSVIEALACGLPAVGFATGSLPELINGGAGKTAPYRTNYWNLEPPDVEGLANAALDVLKNQDNYRAGARLRAESLFDVNKMVEDYLDVLLGQ